MGKGIRVLPRAIAQEVKLSNLSLSSLPSTQTSADLDIKAFTLLVSGTHWRRIADNLLQRLQIGLLHWCLQQLPSKRCSPQLWMRLYLQCMLITVRVIFIFRSELPKLLPQPPRQVAPHYLLTQDYDVLRYGCLHIHYFYCNMNPVWGPCTITCVPVLYGVSCVVCPIACMPVLYGVCCCLLYTSPSPRDS